MNDIRDRFRRRFLPGDVDSATGELDESIDVTSAIVGESAGLSPSEE